MRFACHSHSQECLGRKTGRHEANVLSPCETQDVFSTRLAWIKAPGTSPTAHSIKHLTRGSLRPFRWFEILPRQDIDDALSRRTYLDTATSGKRRSGAPVSDVSDPAFMGRWQGRAGPEVGAPVAVSRCALERLPETCSAPYTSS